MYIYYVLRGIQQGQTVELEDEVTNDVFPDIDLNDGPAIISTLVLKLQEQNTTADWYECDLTDSFFEREDNYVYFNKRWQRRSDIPLAERPA